MKKITLLVCAVLFTFITNAQTTLELNDGDTTITGTSSVGCPSGDNNWGRNFVMADFGVTNDFQLNSGEIGVQTNSAETSATVNVYLSNATFDEGTLVLVGSQAVTIPTGTDETAFAYTFDTPVIIPSGTEAVFVEITVPAASFFIGGTVGNTAGSFSWLKSVACGVPDYVTATSIGFADAHFYITVTGDDILGIDSNALSQVSIYPNPANSVINLKVPASVTVNNVILYDVLGKNTGATLVNGQISVADLSRGVYLLNVNTSAGTLTKKVVKQ